jgi:hypothetical protein
LIEPVLADPVVSIRGFQWALVALGVVAVVYGDLGVPKLWRGLSPTLRREEPPRWWLWGGTLWRGYSRGLPTVFVGGFNPIVFCVLLGGLVQAHSSAEWIVYVLAYIGSFFLVIVWGAITLFARPKFLIPPHQRDQPGALSEWWSALRGTRRRPHSRNAAGS